MLAGVANSGNAVIGLYSRRSWLFVAPISLLDICTASLRVLSWALPRRLVFLRHEATVADHSKSAVDALSVPGAEQDLRGTIEERQRTVPRLLE